MSRRSRRAGERSSTPAGVPRTRVWQSSWRSSSWPRQLLQDTDPVDLSPFDAAEVLGPDNYVIKFNRQSHALHPSPLAKQPRRGFNALGARIAREVQTVRAPKTVLFCVQRKQRKQVLFAKRIAGRRGVGRGKRWFRSSTSQYRC